VIDIRHGDCLELMADISGNSIDAMVTDPPAGIGFMGKSWDSDKGGSDEWIRWMEQIMLECLRVLKPGGHALVWAIPRTSHWTASALDNAGFEIRDVITHLFGSGFPKSHNISKAIDKAAGIEREIVGPKKDVNGRTKAIENWSLKGGKPHSGRCMSEAKTKCSDNFETRPATPEAKQWDGWGTALKPAAEFWILCRKPQSEKNHRKKCP